MPSVLDALPVEAVEVVCTGSFVGEKRGYYIAALAVWGEPVDGPDPPLVGVLVWEHLAVGAVRS